MPLPNTWLPGTRVKSRVYTGYHSSDRKSTALETWKRLTRRKWTNAGQTLDWTTILRLCRPCFFDNYTDWDRSALDLVFGLSRELHGLEDPRRCQARRGIRKFFCNDTLSHKKRERERSALSVSLVNRPSLSYSRKTHKRRSSSLCVFIFRHLCVSALN